MKVNDKVYRYEIKLNFKDDSVEQEKTENKIIGINENYLCVDSFMFMTIKYKAVYKGDNDTLFNEVNIVDYTDNNYLNYLYGYVYTTVTDEKLAYAVIKKALEKHINKKLGKYSKVAILLDKIII